MPETVAFGRISPPPTTYSGMVRSSFYLPMRDGVRLAITLRLPRGLAGGEKLPALLVTTRYWRELELHKPFAWFMRPEKLNPRTRGFLSFFIQRGYALVQVDERGTGASFGRWPYPWHPRTLEDASQVVDWIVKQPWSNGKVGGYGISYLGTTAELLATIGHPAVKAVAALFNHPDPYLDIAYPGGAFEQRFIEAWAIMNGKLDSNRIPRTFGWIAGFLIKGVAPVDEDRTRQLLRAAVQEHRRNASLLEILIQITCRDQIHQTVHASTIEMSSQQRWDVLAASGIPVLGWGSWMDAGTAEAVLRRFTSLENANRAVVGAWEHGGQYHASPYVKPGGTSCPPLPGQWSELLHFFDAYLKTGGDSLRDGGMLDYYTLGEEKWKHTSTWPLPNTHTQTWYLADQRRLLPIAPGEDQPADVYPVNFSASTGEYNRWWELGGVMSKPVIYANRAAAAQSLLTYISPPLEDDLEITGHPIIHLYLASNEPDGNLFVYLEDVFPDGRVVYLTEGILRLIHRRVLPSPAGFRLPVPYHSFFLEDLLPMTPGEPAEINLGLLPVSALLRKGHRLRIGIAGHDTGTFARRPGEPVWQVFHDTHRPSHVDLPIIE